MYYLRETSLRSGNPVFQKLDSKNTLLFPEFTIARDFATSGNYEQSLIEWARDILIKPDQNFVDIGAHVGTYSLSFAPVVNHVYAFECSPRTHNILCGNIALRELDYKITTFKTALGNDTGKIYYYMRSNDGGGNGGLMVNKDSNQSHGEVPIAKLDDFHLENIGLIKIDVEGFEKQVIEGGFETLRRNNYPKLLFESWAPWRETEGIPAVQLRTELFDYIRSIGYNVVPVRGWDEMFIAEHTTSTDLLGKE